MSRCTAIVVSVLLLLASDLCGQVPRPSHKFDPDETAPKNLSKLLEMRRNRGGFDPELLRDIIKHLPRDLDPMQFDEETIRKFLAENPALSDPQNLERLRDIAKQEMQQKPDFRDPQVDWKNLENTLKKIENFHKQNPVDPQSGIEPRVDPTVPNKRPNPPPVPKKSDKQTQELSQWLAKSFGDSPVMRDSLKDFAKIMSQDGKAGKGTELLSSLGKEWQSFISSDGKLGNQKSTASKLGDLASSLRLPDLGTGSGQSSNSGGSNWNVPSSPISPSSGPSTGGGFGGSWAPVIIVGLVVVGGVLFWFLYVRQRQEQKAVGDIGKRFRSTAPEKIETREDVVKAFEYLTILKYGEEALNWHHHQIADKMGSKANCRDAADRLASLYEKARYAPANELFDETEVAEARARFQQLGGI